MEVYELESCVRGHHIYRRIWRATVDEPEPRNKEDPYAVAVISLMVIKALLQSVSFLKYL